MDPMFYIKVALALTSALLASIFFLVWKTQGQKRHTLIWALAFAAATLQWNSNLLSDGFPSWEAYWIIVNGLALLVLSLGLLGHVERVGLPIRARTFWLPPLLCLAAIAWFTTGNPHAGLQLGLIPIYSAITMVISSVIVLRHRQQPADIGAALVMVTFAASQLAAGSVALFQGSTSVAALAALYSQINFLALPSAYIGIAVFVLFMLSSDLAEEMKELAIRDQLTGLLNRRGFGEAAARAYRVARRSNRPVSVVMTDIDRFKRINDHYGHHTGDHALAHFAGVLAANRRTGDILARIGGEEFALVLPGTNVEQSLKIADQLCKTIQSSPMDIMGETLPMTASFGVATISAKDTCLSDVVVRADAALYRAKESGRNRIDLEASQMMLLQGGKIVPANEDSTLEHKAGNAS